jgi:hypothetical protein
MAGLLGSSQRDTGAGRHDPGAGNSVVGKRGDRRTVGLRIPAHPDQLCMSHRNRPTFQSRRHLGQLAAGRHHRQRKPSADGTNRTTLAGNQSPCHVTHTHYQVNRVGAIKRASTSQCRGAAIPGLHRALADLTSDRPQFADNHCSITGSVLGHQHMHDGSSSRLLGNLHSVREDTQGRRASTRRTSAPCRVVDQRRATGTR